MILHISCDGCESLRSLDFVNDFISLAGNRCCFCGIELTSPRRGFEFFGSEITCQNDHTHFQTSEQKSKREVQKELSPEKTLIVEKVSQKPKAGEVSTRKSLVPDFSPKAKK